MILLVNWSAQASVMVILTLAVVAVLRGRSAAVRHCALLAGLLATAIIPAIGLVAPALDFDMSRRAPALMSATEQLVSVLGPQPDVAEVYRRELILNEMLRREHRRLGAPLGVPIPSAVSTDRNVTIAPGMTLSGPGTVVVELRRPALALPRDSEVANELGRMDAVRVMSWLGAVSILTWVWLAGATVNVIALIVGAARLTRIAAASQEVTDESWLRVAADIGRDYGLRCRVRLLRTDRRSLLATWGIFRPIVFLPPDSAQWSDTRIHAFLSHELAHIQRADWLATMVVEALRVIHWFNPLIGIACRRLRLESAQACDDAVLRRGVAGTEYATHLTDLARTLNGPKQHWAPAAPMTQASMLERRIRNALDPYIDRGRVRRVSLFAIAALFLAAVIPVAGVRVAGTERRVPRVAPGQAAIASSVPAFGKCRPL